jgi:hypothetical protein
MAVPPIMSGFIVNAVVIALAGGRFGVVTTTIVRYTAIIIRPTMVPLSSAFFVLKESGLCNIDINRLFHH